MVEISQESISGAGNESPNIFLDARSILNGSSSLGNEKHIKNSIFKQKKCLLKGTPLLKTHGWMHGLGGRSRASMLTVPL